MTDLRRKMNGYVEALSTRIDLYSKARGGVRNHIDLRGASASREWLQCQIRRDTRR